VSTLSGHAGLTRPTRDLLTWSNALDVLIYSLAASSPTFAQPPLAALARLRQTAESATLADFSVVAPGTVALLAPEGNGGPGLCSPARVESGSWFYPAAICWTLS
jgi:hypothetical protein